MLLVINVGAKCFTCRFWNLFMVVEAVHPGIWTVVVNAFISKLNCQVLKTLKIKKKIFFSIVDLQCCVSFRCTKKKFFLMLQKPRLPQRSVSLMWIPKVTDLAIVVSLAMNTRSVPLGKWRQKKYEKHMKECDISHL